MLGRQRARRQTGAVSSPARVVVADDQAPFRTAVRRLLSRCADLEIVGEASDGAAALELVAALSPDLVLLDVRMPGVDGPAAAAAAIRARWPQVAVLLCSSHGADDLPAELPARFVAKEELTVDVLRAALPARPSATPDRRTP
jgi:DNA-binding NarL/FixJ family response regulator